MSHSFRIPLVAFYLAHYHVSFLPCLRVAGHNLAVVYSSVKSDDPAVRLPHLREVVHQIFLPRADEACLRHVPARFLPSSFEV